MRIDNFSLTKVGEAMFFARCRSVHGAFMNRTIHVIFLDEQLRVTSVKQLRPWRMVSDREARHALEVEEATALLITRVLAEKNSFARGGARFSRSDP